MPVINFVKAICLTAGLSVFGWSLPADDPRPLIPQVRVEKIDSTELGEVREFWISLPDGYAESSEKYPVLYMFDGEMNFNSGLIGGLRHAVQMREMPEFIIVGITNTDRSKDIFPEVVTFGDGTKAGGRADPFLDFVRKELIPQVDKNYRTDGRRILYGTSNTGFTAVYALFHCPDLADDYIAASATLKVPVFQDNRDAWIREYKGGRRRLVLVMGENDFPTIISGNGELKEKIDSLKPADLSCRLAVIDRGEHVPANALLEGLRRLFEGWKPEPEEPGGNK